MHDMYLSTIKPGLDLAEFALAAQVGEHLSPRNEGKHQVEVVVVLEAELEVHHEGVSDALEDALLVQGVLHLLHLDDFLLLQQLHGVELLGGTVANQHHPSERAGAQCPKPLEVVQVAGRRRRLAVPARHEVVLGLREELVARPAAPRAPWGRRTGLQVSLLVTQFVLVTAGRTLRTSHHHCPLLFLHHAIDPPPTDSLTGSATSSPTLPAIVSADAWSSSSPFGWCFWCSSQFAVADNGASCRV
jgi:hypothetical protein